MAAFEGEGWRVAGGNLGGEKDIAMENEMGGFLFDSKGQ
jgi:hypothetical protein